VVNIANEQLPGGGGALDVAFQAKRLVAFGEHPGIDRAMRVMAGGAAFADGFVLVNKRAVLGGMALKTGLVSTLKLGPAALDDSTLVRVMAVAAADLAVTQWMMIGEAEFCAHIQVATEAGFRRAIGIDDRPGRAT